MLSSPPCTSSCPISSAPDAAISNSHLIISIPDVIQINEPTPSASSFRRLQTLMPLPSQILVSTEMPQKRNLPQSSPSQDDLVEDFRDALDSYRFLRQGVLHRNDQAISSLPQRSKEIPPIRKVKQPIECVKCVISPTMSVADTIPFFQGVEAT